MSEWRIIITGHKFDLEEVESLFQSPALTVRHEGDEYYFCASQLNNFRPDEYEQVDKPANEILAQMNGLARANNESFQPIRILSKVYVTTSGKRNSYATVDSAEVRVKVNPATVITSDNTLVETLEQKQQKAMSEWVLLSKRDKHVAKALKLFGSPEQNWINLYMVLEVIEDIVGGEGKLLKKSWANKAAIRRFKQTANNYGALDTAARHASENKSPQSNPMSLQEAKELIKTLLSHWIEERKS